MQGDLSVTPLRFDYEQALYEDLSRDPLVREGQTQGQQAQFQSLYQRHLLGTAVKVTESLLPDLYGIYQACLHHLGNSVTGDLYVHQDSQYNAHVYAHEQRFDILLTSALVRDFSPGELSFVIGHELGHVLFGHNAIPAGRLLYDEAAGQIPATLAKRLFQWSRAAEITADRVGFLTCGDLSTAASAFFKTASGLQLSDDREVLRALHSQFEEIARITQAVGPGQVRYASTHPLIPIRFKSLELISLDLLALRNHRKTIRTGDLQAINRQVAQVLSDTEPLNLTESPDNQPDHNPPPQSADFDALLLLCLLYVAVSEGSLPSKQQAFVRAVAQRSPHGLDLNPILADCQRDPVAFRQTVASELQGHQTTSDEVLQILHSAVLLCDSKPNRAQLRSLREINQMLGGAGYLVDNLLG